jgi:F-type H+-transporting ATPase subunit b
MSFEVVPHILIIQGIIFISLIFVLKYLYFDPILKLLKKRESLTSGRHDESVHLHEELETLTSDYNQKIHGARLELSEERKSAILKTKAEAEEKIKEAKAAMEAELKAQEQKLTTEISSARKSLPEMSAKIANEISTSMQEAKVVQL